MIPRIWRVSLSFGALVFVFFAATSTFAAEVKGKVTEVRGQDVTIRLSGNAQVRVGDSVDLSYSVFDEVIGAGTWKVSAVNSDGTVEATPVEPLTTPTTQFDAVIKTTAARGGGSDSRIYAPVMTADQRYELALKLYTGDGMPADRQEAVRLIKQGVEEQHPASMRSYGWFYDQGVDGFPKDYQEAYKWYKKAADGGDAFAYKLLGTLYKEGRGVTKNEAQAAYYYDRSCTADNAWSCGEAGLLYAQGKGMRQDYSRAIGYFEKGCRMENFFSCGYMGWMYATGKGVARSDNQAIAFYTKACNGGYQQSCIDLANYKKKLQEAELARKRQQERDAASRKAAQEMLPALIDLRRQMMK